MKKIFLVLTLIVAFQTVKAQKEIYISDDSARTVSIQGISLNASGKSYFSPFSNSRIQYDLIYFYEKSLSKSVTIMFNGGFSYYQIKKELSRIVFDENNVGYGSSTNDEKYPSNYLNFNLNIEPRYYFSLSNRTSEKRGGLNSGWFMGLPLNFGIIVNNPTNYYLNENDEKTDFAKLTFSDRIRYGAGLNIGYRYAISNKLFTEFSSGVFYINNNDFRVGDFLPLISLNGKISIAYTF